ncbi:uncharacterized protein [Haliotis asinina]|uniref:uncharacterized protein n=1 Tax=Haliotis asinina TaxID=109174 RepID=UPI00353205CB
MRFTIEALEIRIREKLRTEAVVDRSGRKGSFHDLVSIKEGSVGKTEEGSQDQLILTYKRSFLMGLDEQDGSLKKVWGKPTAHGLYAKNGKKFRKLESRKAVKRLPGRRRRSTQFFLSWGKS